MRGEDRQQLGHHEPRRRTHARQVRHHTAHPEQTDTVSAFLNMRVADIHAFYTAARAKGAEFVAEPIDRNAEIRCYLRDPDGYLIEIGQATGILHGVYAGPPATSDQP